MNSNPRNIAARFAAAMLVAAWFATLAGCAAGPRIPGNPDNPDWEVAPIWRGTPPSSAFVVRREETRELQDQRWREITVLKNVATPSVTVIRPPAGRANGAAMIVLPGGAFGALAWDVEGTEVGEWLAERGVTAFVLRYRVRTPTAGLILSEGLGEVLAVGRAAAGEDAAQAVRFVRSNARRYGVDPDRVGMMGFSAGGATTLRVLQDAEPDARPDIAASVYGLMLDEDVRPESTPMFIAVSRDDLVAQSDSIRALWQRSGAPSEYHVFESGGHGFGLGRPGTASTEFPSVFEDWLRAQGFIRRAGPPAEPWPSPPGPAASARGAHPQKQ